MERVSVGFYDFDSSASTQLVEKRKYFSDIIVIIKHRTSHHMNFRLYSVSIVIVTRKWKRKTIEKKTFFYICMQKVVIIPLQ